MSQDVRATESELDELREELDDATGRTIALITERLLVDTVLAASLANAPELLVLMDASVWAPLGYLKRDGRGGGP